MAPSANNVAYTALINPAGSSPVLTRAQIWKALLLKIRSAETFVPGAIQSTVVLSESVDPVSRNPVTEREVVFREGQRKVKEIVTAYEDCRVVFDQPDGSTVSNIVSEGADGELYLTYVFEWRHAGLSPEELAKAREKERHMAKMAVEGTITAMRELVKSNKI
ncbi:hypothetical protein VTK73DRAFT_8764 [Phialemonium thermophilum]|uniref:DUF1857-domain-containing protein n=1 Tax=Phialemonium thermophilum TaxID=223376 RepID=A0ABR3W6E0_9PEZI